jgi:hypothetical protein
MAAASVIRPRRLQIQRRIFPRDLSNVSPLLGERAGVREDVNSFLTFQIALALIRADVLAANSGPLKRGSGSQSHKSFTVRL